MRSPRVKSAPLAEKLRGSMPISCSSGPSSKAMRRIIAAAAWWLIATSPSVRIGPPACTGAPPGTLVRA